MHRRIFGHHVHRGGARRSGQSPQILCGAARSRRCPVARADRCRRADAQAPAPVHRPVRGKPRRLEGGISVFLGHFPRDLRAALLQFDLLRPAQSGRFDHAAHLPAVFHRAEHRARPAVHPCVPARGHRRGGCHRAGAGGERAPVPNLRLRQISGAPPLRTGFPRGALRVCAAPESGAADGTSVFGAGDRHHRDAARTGRLRHRAGRHHGGRKPRAERLRRGQ